MKKNTGICLIIGLLLALAGCATTHNVTEEYLNGQLIKKTDNLQTNNNLYGKAFNAGGTVYFAKIASSDPANAELLPTLWLGFGNFYIDSVPMKAGQTFEVKHKVGSIFNNNSLAETTVKIGKVQEDCTLEVKSDPLVNTPVLKVITPFDSVTADTKALN